MIVVAAGKHEVTFFTARMWYPEPTDISDWRIILRRYVDLQETNQFGDCSKFKHEASEGGGARILARFMHRTAPS